MKHAHAGHHSEGDPASPLGMRIGATMAVLGATLALFTVTGNSARTELLGIYTQETIASLHVETSDTKYRVLETQLRQLHALTDLTPARPDIAHLARLTRGYRAEREAGQVWLHTFDEPKARLTSAIEHYEWAELFAELGIVASSLALLLSNRKVWVSTLVLGAAGIVVFSSSFFPTRHALHEAEHATAEARSKADAAIEVTKAEEAVDDALLLEIEQGH